MLVWQHAISYGALPVLSLLPTFVHSFDCSKLTNDNKCPANYPGSLTNYPECLVSQWGVSAFIQCATQQNAPQFAAGDLGDDDTTTVSALQVLTSALNRPECDGRPIKGFIEMSAQHYGGNNVANFARYLCNTYHPLNAGMCYLRRCINGPPEHSIEALCASTANNLPDLMTLPTLPKNCDETSSGSTSNGDSGSAAPSAAASSNYDSNPTSGTAASFSDVTQQSPIVDLSATSPTSSATSQTSPTATTAPSMTTTSISPTTQATSNAAAMGHQSTYLDSMKKVTGAVALIMAMF